MGEYIRNNDASIGGSVGEVPAREFLATLGLSAHALVAPDGAITRCIPSEFMAAHALGHNNGTLGIELLVEGSHDIGSLARAVGWNIKEWKPIVSLPAGNYDWSAISLPKDPYTEQQYQSLAWWLANEAKTLGLSWNDVTSHDHLSPERKFDPGPVFNWNKLQTLFEELM